MQKMWESIGGLSFYKREMGEITYFVSLRGNQKGGTYKNLLFATN